jgi:hypothetical protein
MRSLACSCFALMWLVTASATAAESQKLETATVVVQGKVRAVFREDPEGDGALVRLLFEVDVDKVEKAGPDGLKPGKVLYAWTHRVREVPMKIAPAIILPFVKPAKGDTVKVYCYRQEDGSHCILMHAQAIQVLERAKLRSGRTAPGDEPVVQAQEKAGKWLATVEATQASPPGGRAIAYRQRVLRQGPDDAAPVLLYEQTSTGRVGIRLRDDGLLLVQPIGPLPRLYFPGSKEPVQLELPPPRKMNRDSAYTEAGSTWFLDDCLFHSRMAAPGRLLIGFVRIDAGKKAVAEARLCLEVAGKEQGEAYAAAVMPVVFRADDYVFWVNTGYHNAFYPDAVSAEWKSRRLHVLSLKTGTPVDLDRVPVEMLRRNRERLLDFVEKQAHNRSPELEVWAVGILARVGGPKEAGRLRALSRTVAETMIEVAPNELRTTDRVVKDAYARALEALEKTGPR